MAQFEITFKLFHPGPLASEKLSPPWAEQHDGFEHLDGLARQCAIEPEFLDVGGQQLADAGVADG